MNISADLHHLQYRAGDNFGFGSEAYQPERVWGEFGAGLGRLGSCTDILFPNGSRSGAKNTTRGMLKYTHTA